MNPSSTIPDWWAFRPFWKLIESSISQQGWSMWSSVFASVFFKTLESCNVFRLLRSNILKYYRVKYTWIYNSVYNHLFPKLFAIECSYLSKFISTIELVFCGQIWKHIVRKKEGLSFKWAIWGFKSNTLLWNSEVELWDFEGDRESLLILIDGRGFLARFWI